MAAFSFIPLARLQAPFELSREDGHSGTPSEQAPNRTNLLGRNELSPSEALTLVRSIRAKALKPLYPDSTESIREDRDEG